MTLTPNSLPDVLLALQSRLRQRLPGRAAQGEMAPRPRSGWDPDYRPETPPRQGGVLALLYPKDDQLFLPFILRPTYDGVHSDQIGFPGGAREPADADLVETALRETQEEIGVPPESVTVLGQLTPLYIHPSNFEVLPSVGWTPQPPRFQLDPREVAQLIQVPLTSLQDPRNQREEEWKLRNRQALVRFFHVQDQRIWGATAMMLSELLAVLHEATQSAGLSLPSRRVMGDQSEDSTGS